MNTHTAEKQMVCNKVLKGNLHLSTYPQSHHNKHLLNIKKLLMMVVCLSRLLPNAQFFILELLSLRG